MHFRASAHGPIGPRSQPLSRFQLEQAVIQGFEAWWAFPQDDVMERNFALDAVLVNHCPKHLNSFGGRHCGPNAILSGFRRFVSEFSVTEPCVTNILTDGHHVAVAYSVLMRHVGVGRSARISGMAHVTLDLDARIKRIENYFDTAAVAEVGDMLDDFAARSEALDRASRASFVAAQEAGVRVA